MPKPCKSVYSKIANPFRLQVKVIHGSHAVYHGPKRITVVNRGSNKYSFLFIAYDDCRFLGCPWFKIKFYNLTTETVSQRHPNHMVLAILKRPNKRHQRKRSFFQNGPIVNFFELSFELVSEFVIKTLKSFTPYFETNLCRMHSGSSSPIKILFKRFVTIIIVAWSPPICPTKY